MNSARSILAILLFFASPFHLVADDKPTSTSDARAAIEANLRTPEGQAYDQQFGKEFLQKYPGTLRQCKQSGNELADFWILVKLDKDGVVKEALLYPSTKIGACTRETLLKDRFSAPPRPAYWVSIYLKLSH